MVSIDCLQLLNDAGFGERFLTSEGNYLFLRLVDRGKCFDNSPSRTEIYICHIKFFGMSRIGNSDSQLTNPV